MNHINEIYIIWFKTFRRPISKPKLSPSGPTLSLAYCRLLHRILSNFQNQYPILQSLCFREIMESQFQTLIKNYKQCVLRIYQHPQQLCFTIFAMNFHKHPFLSLSGYMPKVLEKALKPTYLNWKSY